MEKKTLYCENELTVSIYSLWLLVQKHKIEIEQQRQVLLNLTKCFIFNFESEEEQLWRKAS